MRLSTKQLKDVEKAVLGGYKKELLSQDPSLSPSDVQKMLADFSGTQEYKKIVHTMAKQILRQAAPKGVTYSTSTARLAGEGMFAKPEKTVSQPKTDKGHTDDSATSTPPGKNPT